jgi:diaminopimelate epimerase
MEFVKVHGTGNDFVLLPDLDGLFELDADFTRALCDRRSGIGADGAIRLAPAGDADAFMDYRNADGSIAEMCGNGVRCVAKYLADRGLVVGDVVHVGSRAGVKTVEVVGRHDDGTVALVRVDMGPPLATGTLEVDISPAAVLASGRAPSLPAGVDLATSAEHRVIEVSTVSMGNPHAVLLVDDPAAAPVAWIGPYLERHEAFPSGTNVEFIAVPDPNRVVGRIWERGVGETRASGTGASAMAVAAHMRGLAGPAVTVALPGGHLDIELSPDSLFVTGPAVEVASGTLDARWRAAARGAPLEGAR